MERIREGIEGVFERWSRFIAGHPWKTVFIVVILNTMFGLQLVSQVLNNNIRAIYVADDTDSTDRRDFLLEYFPDQSGDNFDSRSSVLPPLFAEVIVSGVREKNVLSGNITSEVERLVAKIKKINVTTLYDDIVDYTDICAKKNGQCVIEGLSNEDLNYFSDIVMSNGTVVEAKYQKIRFYLRQESDARKADSIKWMERFVQSMKTFHSEIIEVLHSHSLAFFQHLNDDTYVDIRYFGLAFTVFITYSSFLTSGGDCLSKRTHLSRMGIIVTPLSIMGAWGFLSGCGLEFTNVTGIMPFAALCEYLL